MRCDARGLHQLMTGLDARKRHRLCASLRTSYDTAAARALLLRSASVAPSLRGLTQTSVQPGPDLSSVACGRLGRENGVPRASSSRRGRCATRSVDALARRRRRWLLHPRRSETGRRCLCRGWRSAGQRARVAAAFALPARGGAGAD